jgi:D-threonate/D-erythronate kinase
MSTARRPLIVLADDLTGAAEVAALAHEAGLLAVVLTQVPKRPVDADVLVLDTDTRLATPGRAARRVRTRAVRLRAFPHGGVFKKTDSVLRGPVLAELSACAEAFGFRRSLLIAGNPSLGRTIRDGRCFIDGQPIDQTAFARDPHHPARSAAVSDLLHAADHANVFYRSPNDRLPPRGIIVGEHRSAADTAHWANAVGQLDKHTLPAGGADFFRVWLRSRPPSRPRPAPAEAAALPGIPALLLHGTTTSPAVDDALPFKGLRPPPAGKAITVLRQRKAAVVTGTAATLNDPAAPARIASGFAELTLALHNADAFRHLLIAGGATAATVLRALGWSRLTVVRVWGPGVVTLRPAGVDIDVTLKPGSYPWPAELRRLAPRLFPAP